MRSYRLSIPLHGPDYGNMRLALPKPKPVLARPTQHKEPLHRLMMYFWVILLVSVAGCATLVADTRVGVRSAYTEVQVQKILVIPVQMPAPFGMSAQEQEEVLALYGQELGQNLRHVGFTVIDEEITRKLILKHDLSDALDMEGHSLGDIFEDKESEGTLILEERLHALQLLAKDSGADAVMLGQVIYHSKAQCDATNDSAYTPHIAFVDGEPEGPGQVPCAISHFEAKMVHPGTGQTLWYNRALRELRARHSEDEMPNANENARDTVNLVVTDHDTGLPGLRAQR